MQNQKMEINLKKIRVDLKQDHNLDLNKVF